MATRKTNNNTAKSQPQAQPQAQAASGPRLINFDDVLRLCEKPSDGEIRSKYVRSEFARKLGIRIQEIVGLQRQIMKAKGLRLRFPQLGRRPKVTLIG